MSQEQVQLVAKTQGLLHGPLKHVRAAALAAALLPLASVAVSPASAQSPTCGSGGICGLVWSDTNGDGIQNVGEPPLEGVKVSVTVGTDVWTTETGPDGFYYFPIFAEGTYPIAVEIPQGMKPSPTNAGPDDLDSDGKSDTLGSSVATTTLVGSSNSDTDFGFTTTAVRNPGTGTPGYWKNHPEAWPVPGVTIGGIYYLKADAITWLGKVGKDKTTTMFSSLVSAKLNVIIGNDSSCVASTIAAADLWMTKPTIGYGPVGSNVAASSYAWSVGEPLHQQMDAYNNGLLCAPHRN
jgi:SdrD B-like protein